jgi:hypothetical protein
MCVLTAILLERKRYGWLAVLLVAYVGIGFPMPNPSRLPGLLILLYTPRLPLMIAVLFAMYWLLLRGCSTKEFFRDWTRCAWAAAMVISVVFSVHSTFLLERAERQEFANRLPLERQGYLNSTAQSDGAAVRYVSFTLDGYHLIAPDQGVPSADPAAGSIDDDLSFASAPGRILVERAGSPHSTIIDLENPSRAIVDDARNPMFSLDGQSFAFVRDDHGRGRLMVRGAIRSSASADLAITPPSLNVYEASFLSLSNYAFAASSSGQAPRIYLTDATHSNAPLALGESRYPALSPNGAWLAYSHLEDGVWNLWIRDQRTGAIQRIANVPCNELQPSWQNDSKTLLYSTDCGRSLWFTAIARRQVIP